MDIPLVTFEGTLKCHRPERLNDMGRALLEYFFPNFLFLDQFHRGDIKVVFTSRQGAEISGRGRERRYAGDRTLDRGRYFALQEPADLPGKFNTLICELFAYADPGAKVQPSVFDSTITEDRQSLRALGLTAPGNYLAFVILAEDVDQLPPTIGLAKANQAVQASIEMFKAKIERVVDLRLPAVQNWFFETFYKLELENRRITDSILELDGGVTISINDRKLENFFDLLPTLVAPNLGGGLHFLQGIGAWLRSHNVLGLVYPSARTDFGVDMFDGKIVESWGWNFVLYRDSPPVPWQEYFGKNIRWMQWEEPVRLLTETMTPRRKGTWRMENIRTLTEQKFQHAMRQMNNTESAG